MTHSTQNVQRLFITATGVGLFSLGLLCSPAAAQSAGGRGGEKFSFDFKETPTLRDMIDCDPEETASTPESSGIAGLLMMGSFGVYKHQKKKSADKAA
ncbi:MAG: hypothetical protein AAF766_24510 [Cyanobacteria bacterium P01_D01_bin.14]